MSLIDQALEIYEEELDEATDEMLERWQSIISKKGGKGSGHHGHRGRPGKVGGSQARGATTTLYHGTGTDLFHLKVDEVLEDGLEKGRPWHGRSPSVYLAESPKLAFLYAVDRATNTVLNEGDVLHGVVFQVDVPEDRLIKDTFSPYSIGGGYDLPESEQASWRMLHDIPPSWISKYTIYEVEITKEFLRSNSDDRPKFFTKLEEKTLKEAGNYYVVLLDISKPVEKGGKGSGHFGHAGRHGQVGGSLPTGRLSVRYEPEVIEQHGVKITVGAPKLADPNLAKFHTRSTKYQPMGHTPELDKFVEQRVKMSNGQRVYRDFQEVVKEALSKHDKDVLNKIDRIVICENATEMAKQYWGLESTYDVTSYMRATAQNIAGFWNEDRKVIGLAMTWEGFLDMEVIHHEVGHAIFDNADTGRYLWESYFNTKKRFDRWTEYSKKNPHESFAETYQSYITADNEISDWLSYYSEPEKKKLREEFDMISRTVDEL